MFTFLQNIFLFTNYFERENQRSSAYICCKTNRYITGIFFFGTIHLVQTVMNWKETTCTYSRAFIMKSCNINFES